jgi:glycosyltransferase involved in cell wall biosynthesis
MKVSFVIPSYNKEPYLAECLFSVLNQTHKDVEAIVVDDGSTDGTSELMQFFTEKYKNITYINNKTNLGVGMARNAGNAVATGKVICVQDADDLSPLDRAEVVSKYFKTNKDVSILYGVCAFVNGLGEHISNYEAHDFSINKLKNENFIQHPTVAYRKIDVQYRNVRYIDDWYFYLDCVKAGLKFGKLNHILGIYRPLNDGLTLSDGFNNEFKENKKKELRDEFKLYDDEVGKNMLDKKNIQHLRFKGILKAIPHGTKRILDVGCNDGTLCVELRKRGCKVKGIEIAPNLVDVCRKKKVDVEQASALEYVPKEKFDCIIMADILEHFTVDDVRKIVKNFQVTGDETFIITVPYKHGVYSKKEVTEHKVDIDANFFHGIFKQIEAKPLIVKDYAIPTWLLITAK